MEAYMKSPQIRHPSVPLAGVQNFKKAGFRPKPVPAGIRPGACRNDEVGISRFVVTPGGMEVS